MTDKDPVWEQVQPRVSAAVGRRYSIPAASGTGSMAESSKTGRSRDGCAVLPEELVVCEILVRLPAKALLRCRAVCRSWRRLTSTADFLLSHHRHQPSLPLVYFHKMVGSDGLDLDVFDLRQRPTERHRLIKQSWFVVQASFDGLILLTLEDHYVYLCNPTTRQWIPLPSINGINVARMYSHGPSGEYRILYLTRSDPPVWYVLTIGSSAEPRCIEQPFASISVQRFVEGGMSSGPAILLHNCLHWFSRRDGQEAIVVFHTVTESFRLMRLPTDANWSLLPRSPYLFQMDGTLGINWVNENMVMKLYGLQDYETEVWSLKYLIEYPVVEMSVPKDSFFHGTIVSEDGDALIQCRGSYEMFHLDRNGKLLRTLQWQDMFSWASGFQFKESLIRHAFFEGPRCGHHSSHPCFFGGL